MAFKDAILFIFLFFYSEVLIGGSIAADDSGSVVGIHLGTTYSSMGIYRNGKVEIIAHESQVNPCGVALMERELLTGEAGMNESNLNPRDMIFYAKRLIGRKFDDPEVLNVVRVSPYNIIDRDSKPHIEVKVRNGEVQIFSPEEIISMVLQRMKEKAEANLGEKINRAVITVPAYYQYAQATATEEACTIAGLHVIQALKEPVAAIVAYDLDNEELEEYNILVFSLGSCMLEFSVLNTDHGVIDILATSGDNSSGVENFDHRVMENFKKLIKKTYHKDIRKDSEALEKLLRECETAKVALGWHHQVLVEIESFIDGTHFSEPLTRLSFEESNIDLLNKIKLLVKKVLDYAKLKRSDISEIVLVGSVSENTTVGQMLKELFYGKHLLDSVNPDEVLLHGAAILGKRLDTAEKESKELHPSISFYPVSLGIETTGGVMTRVIERDTIIPTRKSKIFTTYQDNQTTVTINIYEGERLLTKLCRKLGSFSLSEIAPAPRGVPQIEVSFQVDHLGVVQVTAVDNVTKIPNSITIASNPSQNRGWEEMQNDIVEAEKVAAQDRKTLERIEARKILETYFQVKSFIVGNGYLTEKIKVEDKESPKKALKDVMEWLEELENKVADWEEALYSVVKKIYVESSTRTSHHDEL